MGGNMALDKNSRVVVIMGGLSEERPVSMRSGRAVLEALKREGFNNAQSYVVDDETLPGFPASVNFAFIAMHGRFGEDGILQAMLEKRGVRYLGSGPGASRICMNKARAKEVFNTAGVPTPKACVVNRATDLREIETRVMTRLGLPVVVKPVAQGSSVGVSIARDGIELLLGVTAAFAFDDDVIVEQFIEGRELTVGILGCETLPIVEVKPGRRFYDYAAKYEDGGTAYRINPKIEKAAAEKTRAMALRAFGACGCRHFARADFRLNRKNEPFILEINTIPGMTERSLFPMAANAAGLTFGKLCVQLCELAFEGEKKAEVA